MKRLLIIGTVLVGLWFLFSQFSEDSNFDKINESLTTEEGVDGEVKDGEDEMGNTDSKSETEVSVEAIKARDNALEAKVNNQVTNLKGISEKLTLGQKDSVKEVVKEKEEIEVVINFEELEEGEFFSTEAEPVVKSDDKGLSFVKVYLYDYGIDVSSKEVRAGEVTIEVNNNGIMVHDFSIRGGQSFGKVYPGQTKFFNVNLGTGKTDFYSNRDKDIEMGMTEIITVIK